MRLSSCNLRFILLVFQAVTLLFFSASAQVNSPIITDVTRLNPIQVESVISPKRTEEIVNAVRNHPGPVSIGGGRYSMGGQTATEHALHIDMREFDSILNFSPEHKEITVQAGITWRKIQEHIDPYNLSIKIMQTYANFTVGGSLSVNAHGRYIGQGPIILSVKQFKIVLANGGLLNASRTENSQLFFGAIGGYGGIGVITEVTLLLTDNSKVERMDKMLSIRDYSQFFFDNIQSDSMVVFHNADIYPTRYRKIRAVTYRKTTRNVTVDYRLKPLGKKYTFRKVAVKIIADFPGGKWLRQHLFDPITYHGNPVEWRNYEASYDVLELEPKSRKKSTYVLQEYFVPVDQINIFYPLMISILKKNKVNVMNISIRHSRQDPGSLLAWAKSDVFAFVLYYKQGIGQKEQERVKNWTREIIDASISCKGTYYLPYQIHATQTQFESAYPAFSLFFLLKKQYDPTNKFRNKLWDAYYN